MIQDRLDEVERERRELLRLLRIAKDREAHDKEAGVRRTKTGTPGLLT